MSETQVIRYSAPTLAGIKTGSLFPCSYESKEELKNEIRAFNRILVPKGLCMVPLKYGDGKALIYVFRPDFLKKDLNNNDSINLLLNAGYPGPEGLGLGRLADRIRDCDSFPHEIGLFLGYPPEDVAGFMENKGKNYKCSGLWKVYGDRDKAEKLFSDYKACTSSWCRKHSSGVPFERLVVAV